LHSSISARTSRRMRASRGGRGSPRAEGGKGSSASTIGAALGLDSPGLDFAREKRRVRRPRAASSRLHLALTRFVPRSRGRQGSGQAPRRPAPEPPRCKLWRMRCTPLIVCFVAEGRIAIRFDVAL
jgi:hypothetical protein